MLICVAYTVEKDTEDRSYWIYDTDDNTIEKCNKEGVCFALDSDIDIHLLGYDTYGNLTGYGLQYPEDSTKRFMSVFTGEGIDVFTVAYAQNNKVCILMMTYDIKTGDWSQLTLETGLSLGEDDKNVVIDVETKEFEDDKYALAVAFVDNSTGEPVKRRGVFLGAQIDNDGILRQKSYLEIASEEE